MILQELAFPASGDKLSLFFRCETTNCVVHDRKVLVLPGECFSTDTFYNSFDLEVWRKYCHLQNLMIEIEYEGNLKIFLKSRTHKGIETIHEEIEFQATRITTACFAVPEACSGRVYCQFKALKNQAKISAIRFVSSHEPGEADLGFVICTYRREKNVQETINLLEREILQNPSSRLYGRFRITVIDNGRTLPEKEDGPLAIVHSENTGGTGGFMQGLLSFRNKSRPPSFLVFMDDDADVYSETIERTWAFMASLKKEYERAIIAGCMLRKDAPGVLHESTAGWNGIRLKNLKTGLHLENTSSLDEYHRPVSYQHPYAAWWYCAFALRKNEGYPCLVPPFFIKGDDVFFSLKNASTVISLSGIAVRHDSFDLKYAPEFNRYFALRNLMIINTRFLRLPKIRNGLSTSLRILAEIAVYNYRSAALCLRAFQDYQKGPGFLMSVNQNDLLKELKSVPEIVHPVDRRFERRWDDNRTIPAVRRMAKAVIRLLTLSGHLIPSVFLRKETVITLGYTNLSLVPLLSRSYYAVSKDDRIFVVRHINQISGIKLIVKLALVLLKYSFSSTESDWKNFFSNNMDKRLDEYWKSISTRKD